MLADGPGHDPEAADISSDRRDPVVRRAFTLRLKPGALDEYVRQHDEIWPELVAELGGQGISELTIFERDGDLFVYCEATDYEAMDRVWASEVHDRWAKVMDAAHRRQRRQQGGGRAGHGDLAPGHRRSQGLSWTTAGSGVADRLTPARQVPR